MRFTRRNWMRYFDGHNKQTTIRLKKSKIGHHKAYAGSYYHPEILGDFDIIKICGIKIQDLTEQNAKDDGFDTLEELQKNCKYLMAKLSLKPSYTSIGQITYHCHKGITKKLKLVNQELLPNAVPNMMQGTKHKHLRLERI